MSGKGRTHKKERQRDSGKAPSRQILLKTRRQDKTKIRKAGPGGRMMSGHLRLPVEPLPGRPFQTDGKAILADRSPGKAASS